MKQVIYNGGRDAWYPCSDPSVLSTGKVYTVVSEKVSDWHTEYTLQGVEGEFNSVWFTPVKPIFFAVGTSIPVKGYSYHCKKIVITASGSGCYMQSMHTSNVQNVVLVGANTYKVTTLNSIYLVTIISSI